MKMLEVIIKKLKLRFFIKMIKVKRSRFIFLFQITCFLVFFTALNFGLEFFHSLGNL